MNTQPIEKRYPSSGHVLDVVSIFPTIQGEGPYTGHRAIFIRLAGCNLQCPGCDTNYTEGRKRMHISDICQDIVKQAEPPYLVVITGGEPFRQNVSVLANGLIAMGFNVQVETNGTLPPSPGLSENVCIVCSPKAGKLNKVIADRADAFKYVMNADSVAEDGLPILALDHSARPHVARPPREWKGPIYLQPMDSGVMAQNIRNERACVLSCIEHGYILQLQIHKIVGVE